MSDPGVRPGLPSGPVRIAILGTGVRGREAYGAWILQHPELARIVAVADPDRGRRDTFAAAAAVQPADRFDDWRHLMVEAGRLDLDAMIISMPDRQHVEPALAAAALGIPILLEKPAASTPAELSTLAEAADRLSATITIGHVLRFTPFWRSLHEVVSSGLIGRLMTIRIEENIGFWHFAHSYVRGQWARASDSSPMILAKTCHDLDLILWFAAQRPSTVASIGSLGFFTPANAPEGAPMRCLDGCPAAETCPFYAPRYYVDRLSAIHDWHVGLLDVDTSPAARRRALETGPYGRCVFHCDNDVADHQQTVIGFPDGMTATLSTSAFTGQNTRTVRFTGTKGEAAGHMGSGEVSLDLFSPTAEWSGSAFARDVRRSTRGIMGHTTITFRASPANQAGHRGHSGGDQGLTEAFVRGVRDGTLASDPGASLGGALDSHWLAFAAERSRQEGRTIRLDPSARSLAERMELTGDAG